MMPPFFGSRQADTGAPADGPDFVSLLVTRLVAAMSTVAPYLMAGLKSAGYGALIGSLIGIGGRAVRARTGSIQDGDGEDAALTEASALSLDVNMLEAVTNLGSYKGKAPEAYQRVVDACDALVELWIQVSPGDEPRAMHPRIAATHVAHAKRGLTELRRAVRSDLTSGALGADFDEYERALAKQLSDYQHNVSLSTMLYLPNRQEEIEPSRPT